MSDFLLVTSEEWIEVINPHIVFGGHSDMPSLQAMVSTNDWGNISQLMESVEILVGGVTILEARMANVGSTEQDYRFWYRV